MAALNKAIDKQSLKGLSPLGKLTPDKLEDIISKSRVENLPQGRTIFRQGEVDGQTIYLLSGHIELSTAGKSNKKSIKGKSVEAKFPIADQIPRPATARTKTASSLLYIDSSLLEILLDENSSGEYEVTEINVADHATDWMMRFLQSRAFLKLPTKNIQKVLMSMEEIHAFKEQTLIRQGDDGDYYYVIKSGSCAVSRRPVEKAEDVLLAKLKEGDGFGEESLITNHKRNATVKMLENSTLMRIKKDDFISLLVDPLIKNVHINSLKNKLYANSIVLDIRSNTEFSNGSLTQAKHIPLSMLRLRIPTLEQNKQHLIYAENKDDAKAAAFLLIQHGIECMVILGSQQKITKVVPTPEKIEPQKDMPEQASTHIVEAVDTPTQRKSPEVSFPTKSENTSKNETATADKKITVLDTTTTNEQSNRENIEAHQKIKDEIENIRAKAKLEAEKMLAEANAIRLSAQEDASRLRNKIEKEETMKLKAELEDTRARAEAAIRKSEALAEEIRQQARQESSQIRQQALLEAENIKQELAQLREQESQMKLQLQSDLDIRQKAAAQAMLVAKQEAEEARIAAEQAAQEAREVALREAEATRIAAAQKVEQALITAQQAREVALREAEETRAKAEQAAQQARRVADRLTAEAHEIEREAAQARHNAELEAEKIRQAALLEAEHIKQQARKETVTEEKSLISHKNVFDLGEELTIQDEAVQPYADEASMALKMAKEIKARLLEVEEQRIANEKKVSAEPVRHKTEIKKLDDKIILEGEYDIFVFKEPKPTQTDSVSIAQAVKTTEQIKPTVVPVLPIENDLLRVIPTTGAAMANKSVIDFPIIQQLDDMDEEKDSKKSLITIAASILLVIALSLVAYTTKIQINFTEVDALVNQGTVESEREKIREQARKDFQQKISSINTRN